MGQEEAVRAVRSSLAGLDASVAALSQVYGETLGVRRLRSDVRRLREDLDELGSPAPGHRPPPPEELVPVPDTPYDRSMWTDAEDEGFGAPDRHAP